MSAGEYDPEYERRVNSAAEALTRYQTGPDRYVRMAIELWDRTPTAEQRRILRAIAEHRRTLIVSGNGVGKSYGVALGILSFLYANPDSIAMLTSGSYSLLTDTTWRPMRTIFRDAKEEIGLPGRAVGGEQSPPRLETNMGDEWYFKAVSPTHPDNLEGRHTGEILVVIEEADKPDITREHFDSAGSSITDADDRMIAVANPPKDENNIVYEKMESDRWHVIQFSSFESHNVRVDADEIDGEHVPGLVDLPTVAEDYEAWNGEPWPDAPDKPMTIADTEYEGWPGVDALMEHVENDGLPRYVLADMLAPGIDEARVDRDGLDTRWYRRRLGMIPPDDSRVPRPFTVGDVEDAEQRYASTYRSTHRHAIGADIARGGDRTAIAEIRESVLEIAASAQSADHGENERLLDDRITDGVLDGPVAIDAVGEGSAVADTIRRRYGTVRVERFNAGAGADDDSNYADARTEALAMLGDFLRDGGAIPPNSDLAEELKSHARYCEYEERTLRDATVYRATPKDEIKDKLGRSPDLVDAAAICAWADGGFGKGTVHVGAWGSEY